MTNLSGDIELALNYSSRAQQARRISEDWVARNAYCLRCNSDTITPTTANTRTRDFVCHQCSHAYELKSKCGIFSTRVLDGAYGAMLQTIREGRTPTFLLLEYSTTWSIQGLRAIHHSLITENSIIPRRPLAATARRAGWIGCSIALSTIAIQGQIPIVSKGIIRSKAVPREQFARLEQLAALSTESRSWAATVLQMTSRVQANRFSLLDMYRFESELQVLFPNNRNIKPKIRQQLQVLRDSGLLRFCGRGIYERIDETGA
jgi:type II restriction enzyme